MANTRPKAEDITGQVFGRLTAIRPTRRCQKSRTYYWSCLCECGTETEAPITRLRNGKTRSCGCLQKEAARNLGRSRTGSRPTTWLPAGETGFRYLMQQYKTGAASRNIHWDLLEDEVRSLTKRPCYFCGAPPTHRWYVRSKMMTKAAVAHGVYVGGGIDRLDSHGGYTKGNVVPCCRMCNEIKLNHSVEDLFAHLERMVSHYNSKING